VDEDGRRSFKEPIVPTGGDVVCLPLPKCSLRITILSSSLAKKILRQSKLPALR
jgi:hypothetical protein